MSETRSRISSGPSRFIGGASITANRTALSLVTLSFSKTIESFWLVLSIVLDMWMFSLSGGFCRLRKCCRILPNELLHAQWPYDVFGKQLAHLGGCGFTGFP